MKTPPILLALGAVVAVSTTAEAQMNLPPDPKMTCLVDPSDFAGWYADGTPGVDGMVKPANSAAFPTSSNVCDFYKWGAQMFLWLTSPSAGDIVFDGAGFYTVSVPSGDLIPGDTSGAASSTAMAPALRAEKIDSVPEFGQAGDTNGVLMSQNGSLVYYATHVNDVWAYYNTAINAKSVDPIKMPDLPYDSAQVDDVVKYALAHIDGVSAPPMDRDAMVMEIKSSWVDAATVGDPADYITVTATVPAFDTSDPNNWVPADPPTEVKALALVGLHVVGTVQDHPENVWATFEHVGNTPDAAYWYTNEQNQTVQQPYNSDADFLFMARGGSADGANTECMVACNSGTTIAAGQQCPKAGAAPKPSCTGGIVPSNTVRAHPWGGASNSKDDPKTIANNTMLLSLNKVIREMIPAGDVRANYLQMGAIWTTIVQSGQPAPIPNQSGYSDDDLRGSLLLANTTMETYKQAISCFTCHSISDKDPGRNVSHLMGFAQPLKTLANK